MDWQASLNTILNNPLAESLIQKAVGKPAPAPKTPAPVIQVQNPVDQGMSKGMMIAIGAGVLAIAGVLFLSLRNK